MEIHTRSLELVAALQIKGIDPSSGGKDSNRKPLWFYNRTPELTTLIRSAYLLQSTTTE